MNENDQQEEKHTPLNSFVHFRAPRNAKGVTVCGLNREALATTRMAMVAELAQPSAAEFASKQLVECKQVYEDLRREHFITENPRTVDKKMRSFLSARQERGSLSNYLQGDLTSESDIGFFQGDRAFFLNYHNNSAALNAFAEQRQRFMQYSYCRQDASGAETSIAGVSILYYPAMRVGEIDIPELLAISVADVPEDGMSFDHANVDFFLNAKTAERVQISEDAGPNVTPKAEMSRAAMLENLKGVIGNEQVFNMIAYLVHNPRRIQKKVFEAGVQEVRLDNAVIAGVDFSVMKYQCITDLPGKLAALAATPEPEPHRPPPLPPVQPISNAQQPLPAGHSQDAALSAQQQHYAKLTSRIGWVGAVSASLLFGISFIISFVASDGVFAGFASAALGVTAGVVVPGALFFLFRLGQSAHKEKPIPLIALGWTGVVMVALEVSGTTPMSYYVAEGFSAIGDMMSSAGPGGYAVFGVAAGLTVLALAAYGYCTRQEAKFVSQAEVAKPALLQPPGLGNEVEVVGGYGPESVAGKGVGVGEGVVGDGNGPDDEKVGEVRNDSARRGMEVSDDETSEHEVLLPVAPDKLNATSTSTAHILPLPATPGLGSGNGD